MKKIISIIFLINFISIYAYAESIKDIEIEGISIGDSALKYFDEELIKISSHKLPKTDNKYVFAAIYDSRFSEYINVSKFKYKVYDVIEIYWKKSDKNYTIEVLAGALSKNIGKSFSSEKECISLKENILSKFSLLFSYFSLKKFKEKLDPRKFNGAIFLGLNGPVVKSHGSTDSVGFHHSIDLCYNIVKGNLMSQIKNNLSHLNDNKT